jgi:hypothetical protein
MSRAELCIDCSTDSGRLMRCLFLVMVPSSGRNESMASSSEGICDALNASKTPPGLKSAVVQLFPASPRRAVSVGLTSEYDRRPSRGVCLPSHTQSLVKCFDGWRTGRREEKRLVRPVGHDRPWLVAMYACQYYLQSELCHASGGYQRAYQARRMAGQTSGATWSCQE